MGIFGFLYIAICLALGLFLAILLDQKIRGEGVLRPIYPLSDGAVLHRHRRRLEMVPRSRPRPRADLHQWGWTSFHFDWIKNKDFVIYTVVIAGVWQASGFVMAMFLAGLRGIDGEIMKAAQIDGATTLQLYRRIIIPLLRPVFLSAFIVLAHMAIKSYDLVVALTSGGPGGSAWLPSNFMYEYTFKRNEMAVGSASAVIMLMTISRSSCPISIPNCGRNRDERGHHPARQAIRRRQRQGFSTASSSTAAGDVRAHLSDAALRHAGHLVQDHGRDPERQHAGAAGRAPTFEPWVKAWGETCVGLTCAGIKGYFWNSIKMVVPAVAISTMLGALNGYVLTKWRFPGHTLVFGLMLFACFIPFQSVLLPMATILGSLGRFGVTLQNATGVSLRLRQSDRQSGLRPRRLRSRLHHAVLPQLLRGVPDRTRQGGAGRWRELLPDLPPHHAAELAADHRRHRHLPVHQHLERLPVRLRLRRHRRRDADDGGAQQRRQHLDRRRRIQRQHGRRDDRRLPTLLVYVLAGRYFVRGLMAGAVKG
jgi:ABC-type glycerol-3-phosphate transport system permease component